MRNSVEAVAAVLREEDAEIVVTADAKPASRAYLDRMTARVWPLFREYWFDALIVVVALSGALEIATSEGEPGAPTMPLAVGGALALAITLVLLLRRRFPLAAPASMLIAGAAVSFVDGRYFPFTFAGFLTALTACFLLGMLDDRRQARIGLGLAFAALAVIIVNDPAPVGADGVIIPIILLMVWLFGSGLGRKLEEAREAEERAARIELQRAGRSGSATRDTAARSCSRRRAGSCSRTRRSRSPAAVCWTSASTS